VFLTTEVSVGACDLSVVREGGTIVVYGASNINVFDRTIVRAIGGAEPGAEFLEAELVGDAGDYREQDVQRQRWVAAAIAVANHGFHVCIVLSAPV
jgi:hypothetical protein